MLGMDDMKSMAPVVFDATHALQRPGVGSIRRTVVGASCELARSGMALGLAGLFIEGTQTRMKQSVTVCALRGKTRTLFAANESS